MGLLYHQDRSFQERVKENLNNEFARKATMAATDGFITRKNAVTSNIPEWEALREQASDIRMHVLENLDYYLKMFTEQASINGAQVHFANTASDAAQAVMTVLHDRQARSVVKSKSMVSEEIDLNHVMRNAGIDVTETDLGEWILQLADWDSPSHIIGPALHMDKHTIHGLFRARGYEGPEDAFDMTKFARAQLRKKFLEADVGITGCNFAIAETGSVAILTNEGNGRMVTALPRVQIVLMGMERILPSFKELDAILQIFVRSAVGTACSSYLSVSNGPRRADESDGPEELHIIVIDGGRSDILNSKYRQMLKCIRCGVCQNICPVYQQITGHAYGSIYEGPMGIVLTPLLAGYDKAGDLPYASTLCGACTDHCPVKIPLHELILQHRQDMVVQGYTPMHEKRLMQATGRILANRRAYQAATRVAAPTLKALNARSEKADRIVQAPMDMPILWNWTQSRDFPLLRQNKLRDRLKRNKGE